MGKAAFSAAHFNDEDAARRHLEAIRWPNGPVCPHCGVVNHAYATAKTGKYRCAEPECRKDFTATVGTLFERSKIPLTTWFRAVHLLCSSKKGMSSHQMHRMLGVSYKTAWFMTHRIREGMREGKLALLGAGGKAVESDETFIFQKKGFPVKGGFGHKMKVHSLVERGGSVRSVVMDSVTRPAVEKIIRENVSHEARLMTDTAGYYRKSGFGTASHEMVNHFGGEYVRGDVHTNTLEGYYSVFKRGMKGVSALR